MFQPLFTRVLREDLGKDIPPWVDKILYQINLMTDYLKSAFSKQITIQDNLINPFKTVQVTSTGMPVKDTVTFAVTLPIGYQPKGVQIVNCTDNSGVIVGNAVWAELTPGLTNTNNVTVRAIYGLTSGHTYTITFFVY